MHLLPVLLLALCCISAIRQKEHDMDEGIAFMPGSASGRYEGLTGLNSIRKRRQMTLGMGSAFPTWAKDWNWFKKRDVKDISRTKTIDFNNIE